jgi:2-methylcitrate dehydratase
VELWHKIKTVESPEWTRRYHSTNPAEKAFGGRVEIVFDDGRTLMDQIAVADAHPLGAKPFVRADYVRKFQTLTEDLISREESDRFIDAAQQLGELSADELARLNVVLPAGRLTCAVRDKRGLF